MAATLPNGIWTPTCTPGQKFSVARTVDLLGPPQSVTFDFVRSMWVASTAVLVNDRLASKSLGNNTPPDLSPAGSDAGTGPLAFFHPGMNKLQVVVTVASTRTACNDAITRPFVWFKLYGGLAGELTVGAPKPGQSQIYFQADNGRTVTTRIHLTNNGPDLVPEATFTVRIGGRGFCIKEYGDGLCEGATDYQFTLVHGLGGIECPMGADFDFVTLTCPIADWEPGQTLVAAVTVGYQPDPRYPSWAQEDSPLFWEVHTAQGGPLQISGEKSADLLEQVGLVTGQEAVVEIW